MKTYKYMAMNINEYVVVCDSKVTLKKFCKECQIYDCEHYIETCEYSEEDAELDINDFEFCIEKFNKIDFERNINVYDMMLLELDKEGNLQ